MLKIPSKAFSTWSSLKEFFIFHLVDAYRHKRRPDVAAMKAHFTRGADGGVKFGGWTSSALDSRDPGPSPEDSYLEREWKQILYQAMHELSPAIRTAMEL